MKKQCGHAHPDLMILVVLIAIGAALALPTFAHLFRNEPVSTGGWIAGVIGLLLVLVGAGPFVRWTVRDWLPSRRRPKP